MKWHLNIYRIKTIFLIQIIFISKFYPSTNYYIDATNGNDINDGKSPLKAWKTLVKLNNSWISIQPGDSVLLKRGEVWRPTSLSSAGIIQPPTDKAGTSSAYIVIGAYSTGTKPIISTHLLSGKEAIYSFGLSYFIFQDLELRGSIEMYALNSGGIHDVKFLRLTVDGGIPGDDAVAYVKLYSNYTETIAENYTFNPIYNIELGYCLLQNTNDYDAFNITGTNNYWIHHNTIYNSTGGEAIDFGGGDNITIEYNIISGSRVNNIKVHAQAHTVDNCLIRYNLILQTVENDTWNLCVFNSRNAKVYNNTFYNPDNANSKATVFFGYEASNPPLLSGKGTWGFNNNEIFNNIFYGVVTVGTANWLKIRYKDGSSAIIQQSNTYNQDNNIFHHNYYYSPTTNDRIYRTYWNRTNIDSIYYSDNESYSLNTIMYQTTLATSANFGTNWKESNETNANPLMINPSWTSTFNYGDFHLNSGSPCIGAGYTLPSNLVDLDGNAVPSNTPDIGAFQKQIIISKTLSLNSPNGGENLDVGTIQSISWTSSGINNININYSTDNGSNWLSVASNIAASNTSYSWTVPNTPSTVCKVKLICSEDQSLTSISSSSFTIFTTSPPYIMVNSKAFLQSPYNNGIMNTTLRDNVMLPLSQPYNVSPWYYTNAESVTSIPSAVVDWILIELRGDTSASSSVGKRAAFIKSNGNIVDLDGTSNVKFNNVSNGSYYLVLKHRNHLAIMSTNPIAFTKTTPLYDFTTAQNQAYGTNSMNQLATNVYGLCSGDANADGHVSIIDYSEVGKLIFNEGYLREDLDMNGVVNVLDYQKIFTSDPKYSHVSN